MKLRPLALSMIAVVLLLQPASLVLAVYLAVSESGPKSIQPAILSVGVSPKVQAVMTAVLLIGLVVTCLWRYPYHDLLDRQGGEESRVVR